MKRNLLIVSVIGLCSFGRVHAQSIIQQDEIRRDLYALADDHFRGREAGTPDELKAAVWLADQARKAGLAPAGDDGTYFQFYSLIRDRVSGHSSVKIGDRSFSLWKDVIVYEPSFASIDAPVVFVNDPEKVTEEMVKGKVVALQFTEQGLTDPRKSIPWRYITLVIYKHAQRLAEKGAKGIVFVSDERAEEAWARSTQAFMRGTYRIDGRPARQLLNGVPIIWVRREALDLLRTPDQHIQANIYSENFTYPSVNVVAKVKGTDPKLANEYVLFSGHTDHDGVRNMEAGKDSILNGADDNATACAALLAIGRAFHQRPAKRSALLVWHGAEERGLLGSYYFAEHPTVPPASLVAVLNADMIGMNSIDSAALLGSTPPHLNSAELVNIALAENAKGPKFKLDTAWDQPSHFEGFYFRSDHLPYVRKNIPAIFFTTLTHPRYHTPGDEAGTINIEKLTKVTRWMYATGFSVANAVSRPKIVEGFKLEK
jgi:hypothetical protein